MEKKHDETLKRKETIIDAAQALEVNYRRS